MQRIIPFLRDSYLRFKYRHHAFHGAIDWKWEKINYNRIALVNLLAATKHEPSYLEIGCNTNDLFNSVPASQKVGVDPACGGTLRLTSDAFFAANKQLFDIVFIDGLHTYEQVRKDVVNSIKFLKPGGYIALHDMLPG
ncbi:MAG TPA: class I SAM-dependent methyltransferase, partial [Terriglobales bacterium]|nr:class I SAM-dependent methyltransferase [Terriglobales bacterium]